jgi:hypothetical protein
MEYANKLLCRFGFSTTLDRYQAAANVVFKENADLNNASGGAAKLPPAATPVLEKAAKRGKAVDKGAPMYQYAAVVSSSTLNDLGLPRIIVIGDEKAGKSSTLERIACVDIFPTEKKFCTRQPIHLKMRNNSAVPQPNTLFKVTIPSDNGCDDTQIVASVDEVRSILKNRMEFLKGSGKGIIADQAIVVEIENARVPTMDLIDLPGLFEAQLDPSSNDPKNLSEMVEACTRRYLEDPQTGVVVCVIPANTENLRTSKAIRLMQNVARKSLQKSAIGVFAKSDLSYYHQWASEKDNDGPLHKLESWLSSRDNENFDFLGSGCVAVMNRNTQSANLLDLEAQEFEELEYFKRHLSLKSGFVVSSGKGKDVKELSNKGMQCFGLEALTRKIDQVFCKHIASEWVPKELQKIQFQMSKVQEQLKSLGTDPALLTLEEFFAAAEEWLKSAFLGPNRIMQDIQAQVATVCRDASNEVLPPSLSGIELHADPIIMNVLKRRAFVECVNTYYIANGSIAKCVLEVCNQHLESAFQTSADCEPVRLSRFPAVLQLVKQGIGNEINQNATTFQRETMSRLERVYRDSYAAPSSFQSEAAAHIMDSIAQLMMLPLFAVDAAGGAKSDAAAGKKRGRSESIATASSAFAFTKILHSQLTSIPAETQAAKRKELSESIKACNAIEAELRSFGDKHGAQMPNPQTCDFIVHVE